MDKSFSLEIQVRSCIKRDPLRQTMRDWDSTHFTVRMCIRKPRHSLFGSRVTNSRLAWTSVFLISSQRGCDPSFCKTWTSAKDSFFPFQVHHQPIVPPGLHWLLLIIDLVYAVHDQRTILHLASTTSIKGSQKRRPSHLHVLFVLSCHCWSTHSRPSTPKTINSTGRHDRENVCWWKELCPTQDVHENPLTNLETRKRTESL